MSETSQKMNADAFADLPEPAIRKRKRFSIVWIIPLVAAIAASWMAYKTFETQGPLVTICMETAEGLVPGKTKIKFKDVDVGQVETIEFSKDLQHVEVTARMIKGMERYLRSETLFWVVRARVTPSAITGLSTLFSGAYISVLPTKEGKLMSEFTALTEPPVITDESQGRYFLLRTNNLGSLDVGLPVYFHKVKVGQVVSFHLGEDDKVEVKVFVQAPFHERVHLNTRFWNASGLDVTLDAQGVRVQTESIITILLGGIAFDTLDTGEPMEQAASNAVFALYPSKAQSFEASYDYRERYLLHFNESVRGLYVGAPVEFRGMSIGRVVDIKLQMNPKKKTASIPVIVEIEPERFEILGKNGDREKVVSCLVAMGMRAQLKNGNLITGKTFVDLNLYPSIPGTSLTMGGKYPELPSVPSPLEGLLASTQRIMNKLEQLPMGALTTELRTTLTDIRGTLGQMRGLMGRVDELELLPKAGQALEQATSALKEVELTMAPDSPVKNDLAKLLQDVSDTARSLRNLADYLERQPDALIFGKEKQ
ncbi:MAG: MCE family protein [Proteobacteria bacterium]|nr:MCE family protein [Pseudomonadota bacterium]